MATPAFQVARRTCRLPISSRVVSIARSTSGETLNGGFHLLSAPRDETGAFQQPDVLELLLSYLEGLSYGMELSLEIPTEQMLIESSTARIRSGFSHNKR
jgi:hypothetical protein